MARPLSCLAMLAAAGWCALQLLGCGGGNTDESCPKTCATNRDAGNMITGFTDNTGFANSDEKTCCDICAITKSSGSRYDWDYVILDSLFVPQFCQGLADGHDFTLTNPKGTECVAEGWRSARLQIHGLWPNWFNSYSMCCLEPAPLDPATAEAWPNFSQLEEYWSDPAAPECDSRGVCFNLNHEWQKHGSCFTDSAEKYFDIGLGLYSKVNLAMQAIVSNLASKQGGTMTVSDLVTAFNATIEASWGKPFAINVICDPKGPGKKVGNETFRFISEIQVCFKRSSGVEKGVPLTLIDQLVPVDCPPASSQSFTTPCAENFAVHGVSTLLSE